VPISVKHCSRSAAILGALIALLFFLDDRRISSSFRQQLTCDELRIGNYFIF
jgi:hypothetical protein